MAGNDGVEAKLAIVVSTGLQQAPIAGTQDHGSARYDGVARIKDCAGNDDGWLRCWRAEGFCGLAVSEAHQHGPKSAPSNRALNENACHKSQPQIADNLFEDRLRIKILLSNSSSRPGVAVIVGSNRIERLDDFFRRVKRKQALSRRDILPKTGVLRDHRPAGCQVTRASFAEPPAAQADILLPCHSELGP